ncbi:MAG: GAF domain-containing protein, partial [Anaerolineae bacterium]|nr:GAF domain-containing protein [Anaerolineae bacterium]
PVYKFYLGKLGGYLLGTLFLIAGLSKWVPALVQLQLTERELQILRQKLEQDVLTRTTALRQSEAELQTILDAVPAMIFYKDRENNLVRVNKAFAEFIGLPREKIEGHPNIEFYPRQAENYWAADKKVMASGEPKLNIIETQNVDGEERWLQTNKIPYRNENNEIIGVIGLSLDITEQQEAEERLQRRVTQLALLNDIGEQIAAVLDLESLLSRATRLVQENFDYHHVAIFTPDENQEKLIMRAQSGEYVSYPTGHSLKLGQGMVGWAGKQNEPLLANDVNKEPHYVNLYPDRIPTQSELCVPIRAGKEVYGVLDIQSPNLAAFDAEDVMALCTLADQLAVALRNATLHTKISQRAERLALINRISHAVNAQLELDALLETVYHEITETFDCDAFFIALYDQEREEFDYRINMDQGVRQKEEQGCYPLSNNLTSYVVKTRAPLLINTQQEKQMLPAEPEAWGCPEKPPSWLGVPLLSGEQVLGVLCVQAYRPYLYQEHDQELLTTIANELASAVKNARLYGELAASNQQLAATLAELRAAEEKVVKQERLAVLGQLAGGIAHEYNNFMAVIILYSEMMLRISHLSPTDREKITVIHNEARAAADLTQQILDFGREAMLQPEELEICPFLHEITFELKEQLPPNIEIRTTCQLPCPATIRVDRDRLHQALLNLTDNARLAMPDGGTLSLSVTLAESPPSSAAPDEKGTWIEIAVTDTGIGMSEEVLAHLFEPFFTTRRPLGSGLGLAQVYGTIKQHGGQVKVKSMEHKGTTVTISLPAQLEFGPSDYPCQTA